MKPGEPFDPARTACGFYPPDIVARQRNWKDGQKRLYERLVRWAGRNGSCWHSVDAMADALGKSARQVQRDIAALERTGLIRRVRRGRRECNRYVFLFHVVFSQADGDATSVSYHSPKVTRHLGHGDATSVSYQYPYSSSSNRNELRKHRNSDTAADDDDDVPKPRKRWKTGADAILATVQERGGDLTPGTIERIGARLARNGATWEAFADHVLPSLRNPALRNPAGYLTDAARAYGRTRLEPEPADPANPAEAPPAPQTSLCARCGCPPNKGVLVIDGRAVPCPVCSTAPAPSSATVLRLGRGAHLTRRRAARIEEVLTA